MNAPDDDPWADAARRLRYEVAQHPYLALLAGGGLGCLLAGGFVLRALPGVLSLGVRIAVASALPTLAAVVAEVASPDV